MAWVEQIFAFVCMCIFVFSCVCFYILSVNETKKNRNLSSFIIIECIKY